MLLTVGGAVAGAIIGAAAGQRVYRATGLIRIAATRPIVLKETDQNRSIPMFDGFIQAQQEVITSRETIQAAMQDANWVGVVRERHISDEQFAQSLKAETRRGSDYLRVTYSDPDSRIAATAVRSTLAAYQRSYDAGEKLSEQQRLDELQSRKTALSAELKDVEKEIGPLGIAPGAGATAAIDPLYDATTGRLKRLRAALVDVQCAIAGFPENAERPAGQAIQPGETVATTLMADYTADQVRNQMELDRLIKLGYGEAHPLIVRFRAAVQEDRKQVSNYAHSVEEWRRARTTTPSTDKLKEQEANIVGLCAAAEEDIRRLAAERSRLAQLGARAAALRQNLSEVINRLDVLKTEASQGSRLTIVSDGDKPMTAMLDSRPKTAAVGAAFGSVVPIGLLILMSSMRRRYRSPIDVAEDLAARVPFVAVVPEVDRHSTSTTVAARAIHQLRVRLQPPLVGKGFRAYLITSPAQGDGKTGIAISLALSFAAAGYRTLLVDGDLSTRKLTGGLAAEDDSGFRDAAHGSEPSVYCLRDELSFTPAGHCRPEDRYTLAAARVVPVLDRFRKQFDIIIIDSDSLSAGIAGAVMAPIVDGVLLTVTRDQSHATVHQAMRVLEQQGAPIAGAVFNRAKAAEISAPGSASSQKQPGAGTEGTASHGELDQPFGLWARLRAFGPLVASVMESLAWSDDDELALIAPPPSQPRIHIFSMGAAAGESKPKSQAV